MKIIRKLLWLTLLVLLVLASIAIGYYYAMTKGATLDPSKLTLNEKSIVLYDKDGQSVKNVASFSVRQTVDIEEIPKKTQLAFVDTEDKRFFTHNGFDVKRIAKAALNNIKAHSFKEGASTISQQLIKNTHLSQEKTMKRKLREWKLTRQLEKKYSKEEILEKYLNTIYFGHSCFGIRAAAEFYFGKEPKDLTLADSAILAGLVKSPNNYSPFKNPEKCKKRKESVLTCMLKNGNITQAEKAEALRTPLPEPSEQSGQNAGYLTFVFDELSAITEENGLKLGGKIEIYTGLDPALQNDLEKLALTDTGCDKAALVLDGTTENFKAALSTVGNIRRLPGSLIKPLLVYSPAIEENILAPATPILDEKVNYGGYSPENYDGSFHGYVSARECVEKSLNVPAVKIFQSLGVKKGVSYLKKLGLPTEADDESLALALGGMKNGYTLRDMTAAYSALQNGGTFQNCGFITEIKVNDLPVYKRAKKQAHVFGEDTAYLMTDMLRSTAKTGTAKKLHSLSFDVAAKTGTVGTKNGNTDAYALSYTSRDCVAVWLGNADNSPIEYTGGGMPCNLLLQINESLYNGYRERGEKIPSFQKPKNVTNVSLDKVSYYDTHTIMLADDLAPAEHRFDELFKTTALPTKKSDFFSNPHILSPSVKLADNTVFITFDKASPRYYTYKIERYDYVTHNTLYEGSFIPTFTDREIETEKNYIYTITPLYNGKAGTPVVLPSVSTKSVPPTETEKPEILEKEWWKY